MNQTESCRLSFCNVCNFFLCGISLCIGFTNVLIFLAIVQQSEKLYENLENLLVTNLLIGIILVVNAFNGIIGSIFEKVNSLMLNKCGMISAIIIQCFLIIVWFQRDFSNIVNKEFLKQQLDETYSSIDNHTYTIHFFEQKFPCCFFNSQEEFLANTRSNDEDCPLSMTCLEQMMTNSKIIIKEISSYLISVLILLILNSIPGIYLYIVYQKLAHKEKIESISNDDSL